MFLKFVLLLFCPYSVSSISIEEFGAIPNVYTLEAAAINSLAFAKTVSSANRSNDRIIEVPRGKEFFMLDVYVYDIYDVTFQFDGNILFSDTILAWVNQRTGIFSFNESHHLRFSGNGKLDGNGLKWWRSAYLGNSYRPDMFYFYRCTNIYMKDVNLFNSPRFTICKYQSVLLNKSIYLLIYIHSLPMHTLVCNMVSCRWNHSDFKDCAHIVIHDITIFIDSAVTHGNVESVTYPLNTDGIDIGATNVTIYNCNM